MASILAILILVALGVMVVASVMAVAYAVKNPKKASFWVAALATVALTGFGVWYTLQSGVLLWT